MSQPPNRGSFQRGISGNPGGKPASAEVSALARRYTADWLRGLVGVVRLPVCKENAPSIVSAARELREVGYPGLTKSAGEAGSPSLHLTHGAADRPPLGTLVRRRVVQVAIAAAAEPGYELDRVVLALCDDSTIWWHGLFPYNDWHRLPAVPGTQEETPE